MIKLIACDLDGTIFDDNKNIDSDLKNVVNKLKENDILFTIISGRNEELMIDVVDYFELDIPYACNNGANIFKNHKPLFNDYIDKQSADRAAKLLYDNDIVFRAYAKEDTFCNSISDFFLARMKGFTKPFKDYYRDLDLSEYNVMKITSDFSNHPELIDKLSKEINSYPHTAFVKAEDNVFCVNSITANKGDGLKRVCEYLDIDMKNEVMAFGDNENDLPMLKNVKISVAMDNSDDEVKKQVDYTCLDNNHNGVSTFLKQYFKDIL